MRNSSRLGLALSCLLMLLANSASAITFEAIIDGTQANAGAGTGSLGTGFASMFLVDDIFSNNHNLFSWDISWSGLDNETAVHFHGPAFPDQNAGIQIDIGVDANPAIGSTFLSGLQPNQLMNELWYIDIHTADFPNGEIRGQVFLKFIPIPPALWLFGTGLLGLAGIARRRKVV